MKAPRRVPPVAVVLSAAVAVGLVVLATRTIVVQGSGAFFAQSDAYFFRLAGRDPLGSARGFAAVGQAAEAPYRYGRIGLPLLGWVLATGRPAWVGWSLIAVTLASVAAVPGLAAVLLSDLGAPPAAAGFVLLAPGLVLSAQHVCADPLLISLLLLACILEGRGKRSGALGVLAAAILVKEVAILAVIPWLWSAIARRDRKAVVSAAATVVPYVLWAGWVRIRLGELPFLAHTYSRTGALALPFVGVARALSAHTPEVGEMVAMTVVTIALGSVAAWLGRGSRIGGLAAVFTVLTVCVGLNTVAFPIECERVMAVSQIFAILGIAVALSDRARAGPALNNDAGFISRPRTPTTIG